MYSVLTILSVILSVVLIVVVLLQAAKGNGLAGTFGGAGNIGSVFGTRRTADFLSRATWSIAGAIIVIALLINLVFLPGKVKGDANSIIQGEKSAPAAPAKK